jgi:hypothetical protein
MEEMNFKYLQSRPDDDNGQLFDLVNNSWGYWRECIENDTEILASEKTKRSLDLV